MVSCETPYSFWIRPLELAFCSTLMPTDLMPILPLELSALLGLIHSLTSLERLHSLLELRHSPPRPSRFQQPAELLPISTITRREVLRGLERENSLALRQFHSGELELRAASACQHSL